MPVAPPIKPWDKLAGEDDAAYARFLTYRNLGMARNVPAAYQIYCETEAGVDPEKCRDKKPSGVWKQNSQDFNWVARARAWDVDVLLTHGQDAVLTFVTCIKEMALILLRSLAKLDGPRNWKEAVETLSVLSDLIPPETLAAMHTHAAECAAALQGDSQRAE